MEKIQATFFLSVGFLLGSVGMLYGMTFHYVLLFAVLFYACTNWRSFLRTLKEEKGYLLMFVAYFVYISVQTVCLLLGADANDKTHYGIFEATWLNLILVPVYVATWKEWLTIRLLKRFLFLFCLGCVSLNMYIALHLVAREGIVDVREAIGFLYTNRFGENKMSVLGGSLLLEPQTFSIVLAAFFAYVLIFMQRRNGMKTLCGIMFLLLLLFLSFTVTKAGLLAFLVGFILINIYIFRQSRWRVRLALLCFLFLSVVGVFMFKGFSEKYKERRDEIIVEWANVKQGIYTGGTIAPRVGFIREAYIHADEFVLFGLGVHSKNRVRNWLETSDAGLAEFLNVHNSFLHFWIQGGILGLCIVIFLFAAPCYNMVKNKRFSYLLFSLVVMIFIMNSTCILLDLNNSRFIMVLFLSMFYFHGDLFARLESSFRKGSSLPHE